MAWFLVHAKIQAVSGGLLLHNNVLRRAKQKPFERWNVHGDWAVLNRSMELGPRDEAHVSKKKKRNRAAAGTIFSDPGTSGASGSDGLTQEEGTEKRKGRVKGS
jgi:hypothetical protein